MRKIGIVKKTVDYFFKRGTRTLDDYCYTLSAEIAYKRLAIETAIDLIANAMSKVEFKTYVKGKNKRNDMYYRLNVAPNKKENATEFRKKLVRRLIYDGEVLIVSPKNGDSEIYIADGWNRTEMAMKYDVFTDVTIGNLILDRSFSEEEVFYFTFSDVKLRQLIDGYYQSYGKLLASAMNIYKRSNARRYMLSGNLFRGQDNGTQKDINDMMTSQFKSFMEADNAGAVFQIQKDYELKDMSDTNRPDSRDVKNIIDDIFEMVATALHVPINLLKGNMSGLSDQVDALLMFCIHPMAEFVQDGFNATLYDSDEYQAGNYIRVDTTMIKLTSFKDLVESGDKAIGSGQFTINEMRVRDGNDPVDDPRADKIYITKNYTEVKGGEEENNEQDKDKNNVENNKSSSESS